MKFYISKKELKKLYDINLDSDDILSIKGYETRVVKGFLD